MGYRFLITIVLKIGPDWEVQASLKETFSWITDFSISIVA